MVLSPDILYKKNKVLCPHLIYCVYRQEERITVYPADVVLFEGILVFYPQKVRDMFHMKLFVDTDSDVRLSRRGIGDSLTHVKTKPKIYVIKKKFFFMFLKISKLSK